MSVRCGNHAKGVKVYHASAAEVKNCYATHIADQHRRKESALPAWMTDEDPTYARPQPNASDATPRGWWDLPIARTMWGADARDLGH